MQIRTSQTLTKKYNIFSRIGQLATYGKISADYQILFEHIPSVEFRNLLK